MVAHVESLQRNGFIPNWDKIGAMLHKQPHLCKQRFFELRPKRNFTEQDDRRLLDMVHEYQKKHRDVDWHKVMVENEFATIRGVQKRYFKLEQKRFNPQ